MMKSQPSWLYSALQLLTHSQTTILQSSKLKEFADDNFKLDGNSRKLSKQVENTVGKGVIAHYEQFLLFPQCFQKACFLGASKGVIVWEWVNLMFITNHVLTLSSIYTHFNTLKKKSFRKHCGKK